MSIHVVDVLLRSLGAEEEIRVDVFDFRLKPDDALVLGNRWPGPAICIPTIFLRVVATASPQSAAETSDSESRGSGWAGQCISDCGVGAGWCATYTGRYAIFVGMGCRRRFAEQATLRRPPVHSLLHQVRYPGAGLDTAQSGAGIDVHQFLDEHTHEQEAPQQTDFTNVGASLPPEPAAPEGATLRAPVQRDEPPQSYAYAHSSGATCTTV